MKASLYVLPLFGALLGLLLVSPYPYWRDASEFIISAIYLDIAHPAGFPLFAQLGNLFALLPFGPLAWRVNSFCYLLAAGNLMALGYLSYLSSTTFLNLRQSTAAVLGAAASMALLLNTSFLRQMFTAEVYNLNLLLVLVLLILYVHFYRTRDMRLLLVSAFLGGLGLGNHAGLAVVLLPAAVVICSDGTVLRRCFLPGLLLGLLGLCVYAYLPIRATTALPLNTGEVITTKRLIDHLSVARDRELRAKTTETVDAAIVHGKPLELERLWGQIQRDAKVITTEFGLPVLALGAAGLVLLMAIAPRLGLIAVSAALGTWFFFLGWDPDPWGALFAMMAFGAAFAVATMLKRFELDRRLELSWAGAALFAILAFRLSTSALPSIAELRESNTPAVAARSLLETIPKNSVLVTEAGWFLAAYAHYVEGLLPDVSLVYQPSILFPEYFARVKLETSNGLFDSWNPNVAPDPEARLAAFTDQLTRAATVAFEPNMRINTFYKAVTSCSADGQALLLRGQSGGCGEAYRDAQSQKLSELQHRASREWSGFRADAAHFVESQLTTSADLLLQAGAVSDAIALLEFVCAPKDSLCDTTSLNNLAAYYLDVERYEDAARVLFKLENRRSNVPAAVKRNILLATQHLRAETIETLRREAQ